MSEKDRQAEAVTFVHANLAMAKLVVKLTFFSYVEVAEIDDAERDLRVAGLLHDCLQHEDCVLVPK